MNPLLEKRNNLLEEMDAIVNKSKAETRAFSEEESARFDAIKAEVAQIDKTLAAEEEARSFEKKVVVTQTAEEKRALEIEAEERAFVEFVKEGRAANLPQGTNGAIIPKTIANKIIDKVKNLSPILSKADVQKVKGALSLPQYDFTQHTTAYQGSEFTAITASAGTFTSVDLNGYVIGSLALISKKLVNNSDFDVVSFIVKEIAKSIVNFLESELVAGAGGAGKMKGLAQNTVVYNGATTLVITPQELINMKNKVPQVYQQDAVWIMHSDTLSYLQGLTAGAGNNTLLFGNDLTRDGGTTLLSKPVYLSDNMPVYTTVGAKSIHFGDLSGLTVKIASDVEMQILLEKYADQYALGCVAWGEYDSSITETQKLITYVSK